MTAETLNELNRLHALAKAATGALKAMEEKTNRGSTHSSKKDIVYVLLRDCSAPLRESDYEFVRHWLAVMIKNRAERDIKRFEEAQ